MRSNVFSGVSRVIREARDKVDAHIVENMDASCLYSRGVSTEGFDVGYREALDDVLILLNGVKPDKCYWQKSQKT